MKERISGSNIFEVEKSVISRKGGKLTNTVVKEVFAKVTTRQVKKRSNENVDGHKDAKRVKMSPAGRSNFPPNFLRSRKLRNFGSDIFTNGKSKSN